MLFLDSKWKSNVHRLRFKFGTSLKSLLGVRLAIKNKNKIWNYGGSKKSD